MPQFGLCGRVAVRGEGDGLEPDVLVALVTEGGPLGPPAPAELEAPAPGVFLQCVPVDLVLVALGVEQADAAVDLQRPVRPDVDLSHGAPPACRGIAHSNGGPAGRERAPVCRATSTTRPTMSVDGAASPARPATSGISDSVPATACWRDVV